MNDQKNQSLAQTILQRLRSVIDPETNVDVVRMKLIDNLSVDEDGCAAYTFRPSSPLCPIAVTLAQQVKAAVAEVPGVTGQKITIKDYCAAEALTQLINKDP